MVFWNAGSSSWGYCCNSETMTTKKETQQTTHKILIEFCVHILSFLDTIYNSLQIKILQQKQN